MKKIIISFGLLFLVFGFFLFQANQKEIKKDAIKPTVTSEETNILSATSTRETKFLFVPYWGQTAEKIPDSFGDTLIYFGITPNKNGIDKEEPGYMGLGRFVSISEGRKTLLTLRMVDQEKSFAILKDKKQQERIIAETLTVTKKHNFSGVVLDLEVSSLPFVSITDQMNSFVKDFADSAKKENLEFSMMFFGDTFYRFRSYDVIELNKYIDKAFIMAYDFSKAKQDPGPNFPLSDKEKYGYDFTVMVNDFLNIIPKEKLVIVFGMFGYDWTVDENGKSVGQARPVTLTVAKKQFIDQCVFRNCVVKRDDASTETTVTYIDNQVSGHVIWFEDEDSVEKKKEFLKEKGINAVGFWAYSYF